MSPLTVTVDRRTFLKATGLMGLAAAGAALGGAALRSMNVAAATPPGASPIEALAASLGFDQEAIFRFVADEIGYEPYTGILRGASGTLASRAGNSCDQALLLAELLSVAQVPVRFAFGELEDATADAILASTSADAPSIQRQTIEAMAGPLPGSDAPQRPPPDAETQARLDQARAVADEVVAWAREQLDGTIALLEDAVRQAGATLPDGFTVIPARERREHVWVQAAAGPDWVDLDPILPDGPAGRALTTAATVADMLPDELHHVVELWVVGERIEGGQLVTQDLLGVGGTATELAGLPIAFLNARPEGLNALGASVSAGLGGKKSYLPSLIVGDQAFVSERPIGFAGDPSVLDDGTGSGWQESDSTAEWLDIHVRSPDAEPIVARRAIFDRIGTAERAAGFVDLATLPRLELHDLGDDASNEVIEAQSTHWLMISTGLSRVPVGAPVEPAEDDLAGYARVANAYQLLREAAALELAVPGGVRPFHDAPNIVALRLDTSSRPDGNLWAETGLDIFHRSYGQLPVVGAPTPSLPTLIPGVLAHVAERVLSGDATAREAGDLVPGVSVGAVFDAARAQGINVRAIVGSDVPADLPFPAEARARLAGSLARGLVALVPERPVLLPAGERLGWWLIDPLTGRVTDELDDGGGRVDEYAVTLTPAQVAAESAFKRKLHDCMILTFLLAAGLVELALGAADDGFVSKITLGAGGVTTGATGPLLLLGCR